MEKLEKIFLDIKEILKKHSESFLTTDKYLGSQAKTKKPEFHLYGNKEISLFRKKPQNTYLAGVIQQKNYVSFYFSPIYSHPDSFKNISPELKKNLKGKSCFNIKNTDSNLLKEIEDLLIKGIKLYKELEWV